MSFAFSPEQYADLEATAAESAKLLGCMADGGDERARAAAAAVNALSDKINAAGVPEVMAGQREDRLRAAKDFIADRFGLSDGVREQLRDDRKVTPDEVRTVRAWKERAFHDAEFVRRYLSGDMEAGRQMTLANIVLSSDVAEASA